MKIWCMHKAKSLHLLGLAVVSALGCRAVSGLSDLSFEGEGPGGTSSGGLPGCTPLAERFCYTGPANTLGVGACQAGLQVCESDGSAWGPCQGEALPGQETCGQSGDEDCDGLANEEGPDCGCKSGEQIACYSGPANTAGTGICAMGLQTCNPDGMGFGPCLGEVVPLPSDDCMTPADENCDGVSAVCAGETYWGLHFGGAGDDTAKVVAADSKGNVIVGGLFSGSVSIGNFMLSSVGGNDIFVAKFDKMGNPLWAKSYGSASSLEEIEDLTVDAADSIVFGGEFSDSIDFGAGMLSAVARDGFVVKLAPDGSTQWAVKLSGNQDQIVDSIAVDPQGSVIALGLYESAPDFGAGQLPTQGTVDLYLAKLSGQNGSVMWSKGFADAYPQANVGEVETGPDGSIYLAIPYLGNADFGCGSTFEFTLDALYGKFDTNGNCDWIKIQGDQGDQWAWDTKLDQNGNLFVVGDFKSQLNVGGQVLGATATDIWIGKFDEISGTHQWSKDFGGSGDQRGSRVTVDNDGSPIFVGEFLGNLDFGAGTWQNADGTSDGYVVKLGPVTGEHKWSRHFGGLGIQRARAVAADLDGNVFVAGHFENSIDLGDAASPHDSGGMLDAFVMKIGK